VILTNKKKFAAKCEASKFPLCNEKNDLMHATHKNTGKRYYQREYYTFKCFRHYRNIRTRESRKSSINKTKHYDKIVKQKLFWQKELIKNRQYFAIYILPSTSLISF